ncbi:MAG: sugar ABC transporter ATP-binding protein [Planctomycetes bacterium]|nr:sugar ABC transporter ATP-binding protein [Planctomycetota bacterium]
MRVSGNAGAETGSAATQPAVLRMADMRKSFDGVEVLHGVSFDVRAGEIHALVGENGAGKSTLMKILAGVYGDYTGTLEIDGEPVRLGSPREAEAAGVAIIYQELSLVPYLSVAENMFLGREPLTRWRTVDHRRMRADAQRFLANLAPDVDVRRSVAEYGVSVQQLIEIGKALSTSARILILDEPTSALSESEAGRLFDILRDLKRRGVGLIYISHKMKEVYELADRITVLRDGEFIGCRPAADLPRDELIRWMVGRRIEQLFPKHAGSRGRELLRIEDLTLHLPGSPRPIVDRVSLTIHAGEVVGLGGLMGNGASELLGAAFGRYGRRATGRVFIGGRPFEPVSPRHAIGAGIAMLTNDRKATGLVSSLSVMRNMTLAALPRAAPGGWLRGGIERQLAEPLGRELALKAPSLDAPITALSGGNQQKVVLAKWLMTRPKLLLLDEPTRGIDVGAKAEIYELMNQWTAAGMGILLITSELPELLAMSDRILVLAQGRLTAEIPRDQATQERVMAAAVQAA